MRFKVKLKKESKKKPTKKAGNIEFANLPAKPRPEPKKAEEQMPPDLPPEPQKAPLPCSIVEFFLNRN